MKRPSRLLLVEDDRSLAESLNKVLANEGYEVDLTDQGAAGYEKAKTGAYDLVLTDLRLPGMGGLELIDRLQVYRPRLPVILFTAHGTAETAINATKRGAYDYLLKPFAIPDLLESVARALEQTRHYRDAAVVKPSTDDRTLLVGRSRAMQQVFKEIGRAAPLDDTILIRGETGTGKEMVARALWQHGTRVKNRFLAINCAAIPETLLESELFGHERGAFTGAEARRIGRFEQANGGTLFLDEIGDVSLATQVRLLRVLQERTIQRVGGNDPIPVNVRVVAATHRNLEEAIRTGRFREDLYYRLTVIQITLPPLRDHAEDIPLLAEHFVQAQAGALGSPIAGLTNGAHEKLARHSWPGNIRELENVMRRATVDACGHPITAEVVARALNVPFDGGTNGGGSLSELVRTTLDQSIQADTGDAHARALGLVESELLKQVMNRSGGNQSQAARWLGLSRLTLREKLQRHGMHPGGG